MRLLITGAGGYIGSITLKEALERGFEVLSIDNFSTGNKWAISGGKLLEEDIGNKEVVSKAIREFKPEAVMHFAASIVVSESVSNPLKYYLNNVSNSLKFLESLLENGIKYFIFSSTAAVYGINEKGKVSETDPLNPINPYGESKAFIERALRDFSKAYDFKYISLRYFNVAGADKSLKLGQVIKNPTHLILRALKKVKGEIEEFEIYGDDYPTKDGTCVRDYIHVNDLVDVHFKALEYLLESKKSDVFNVGYSHGYSVREIIEMVKKVTNKDFEVKIGKRREGDPPILIADNEKLKKVLSFEPKYDDLFYIIKTAWEWENNYNNLYGNIS